MAISTTVSLEFYYLESTLITQKRITIPFHSYEEYNVFMQMVTGLTVQMYHLPKL